MYRNILVTFYTTHKTNSDLFRGLRQHQRNAQTKVSEKSIYYRTTTTIPCTHTKQNPRILAHRNLHTPRQKLPATVSILSLLRFHWATPLKDHQCIQQESTSVKSQAHKVEIAECEFERAKFTANPLAKFCFHRRHLPENPKISEAVCRNSRLTN